jgi:hypothetical protein
MIINTANIKPAKVANKYYLGTLSYTNGQKIGVIRKNGIIINNTLIIPSIVNGVLSVENITFNLGIETDQNNEKIYYNNASLKVKTYNEGIDILLDRIDIPLELDLDATQQVLEFVNFETELFKIQDVNADQTFDIVFQVIVDNSIAQEIFVRFHYKPSNNLGDVNGDGVIDLRDMVALSDYVMQNTPLNKLEFADVNKDHEITKHDVIELSRRVLNG